MAESEVKRFSGVQTAQNGKSEGGINRTKHENVQLKKDDVPWAILPREKNLTEECTVKQHQRWLLCRGAKNNRKESAAG